MVPQFTQGVFSQKAWRALGTGPLDDCWIMADLMALHGCAPWSTLPGGTDYRAAAGVPDTNTGSEGGTLEASLKALKVMAPAIGAKVVLYRGAWAGFIALVKAGHPFSGSVRSGSLPPNLQYGYTGTPSDHRIAGYWGTLGGAPTLLIANPLANPHAYPSSISEPALQKAFADYPDGAEVNALIFPTVEEAFKTHPLYVAPAPPPAATKLAPGLYQV